MKGYMGKILPVNLTTRQASEEPLDPQLARNYIGGAGLGIRFAYAVFLAPHDLRSNCQRARP